MLMINPLLMLLEFQLPMKTHYSCSETRDASTLAAVYPKRNCHFCGGAPHNRLRCPSRESVCYNCESSVESADIKRDQERRQIMLLQCTFLRSVLSYIPK